MQKVPWLPAAAPSADELSLASDALAAARAELDEARAAAAANTEQLRGECEGLKVAAEASAEDAATARQELSTLHAAVEASRS